MECWGGLGSQYPAVFDAPPLRRSRSGGRRVYVLTTGSCRMTTTTHSHQPLTDQGGRVIDVGLSLPSVLGPLQGQFQLASGCCRALPGKGLGHRGHCFGLDPCRQHRQSSLRAGDQKALRQEPLATPGTEPTWTNRAVKRVFIAGIPDHRHPTSGGIRNLLRTGNGETHGAGKIVPGEGRSWRG